MSLQFGGSEFDNLLQVKILQCTHAENEKNYMMNAMPYKFSDFFPIQIVL